MRQWFVVVGTAASLFGCAELSQISSPTTEARSENVAAPVVFNGPECRTAAATTSDVLARICPAPDAKKNAVSAALRERGFDDRHPNQVSAAVLAFDGARVAHDWATLGISTYYAEILEPKALRTELDRVAAGLSPAARDAFFNAAIDAKSVIARRATQLDARSTRMYVETPHKVIAKRAEYFKSHAAEYQKLDELEAVAASIATAPRLSALRGDYLAKCEGGDCRFDPFPLEVTRELARVYAASGETLSADAENALLHEPSASRHLFIGEVGAAVYEAVSEEKRFGTPPLKATPQTDWLAASSATATPQTTELGVIRAISPTTKRGAHGELFSQITFQSDNSALATCYEDAKIKGVAWDATNHAHIDYELVCSGALAANATQPLLVRLDEAKWLRPGEILLALVSPDKQVGAVLKSFSATTSVKTKITPVLQVRGERTGAHPTEEEANVVTSATPITPAKEPSTAASKAKAANKPSQAKAKRGRSEK